MKHNMGSIGFGPMLKMLLDTNSAALHTLHIGDQWENVHTETLAFVLSPHSSLVVLSKVDKSVGNLLLQ